MHIEVDKSEFHGAVSAVAKATAKLALEPGLLNIVIRATSTSVELLATDNQVSIRRTIKATVHQPGACAILGSVLEDVVGGMQQTKSEAISLSVDPEKWNAKLVSGDAEFDLKAWDPKSVPDVPPITDAPLAKFTGELFREIVAKTVIVAASRGSGLQTYDGVLWERKDGDLAFVATDSVRLALLEFPSTSSGVLSVKGSWNMFVAHNALTLAAKMVKPSEEVEVVASDSSIAFRFASTEVRGRIIDRTFPNFRAIMPKTSKRVARIATVDLVAGMRTVLPLSDKSKNKVFVEFAEGRIHLSTESYEIGQARRSVDAVLEGPPEKLAFNGSLITDFLSVAGSDTVEWQSSNSSYPAVLRPTIEGSGYTYVVMPITHHA